jgi:glutaredoxin
LKYAICLLFLFFLPARGFASAAQDVPQLFFFYSPGCHECIRAKAETMPRMEKEFKGQVDFVYLDVDDMENYKLLLGLMRKSGAEEKFKVPVFYMDGQFITGSEDTEGDLRSFIKKALGERRFVAALAPADPLEYFKSFVPLSVSVAGLEDGINPCAFTVIVFFMSFLAVQGYRKRELFFIGTAFILAVFLTYLGIGLGIFNFLYRFRAVWLFTHILNISVGLLSVAFGIFALYDFFKFRKTGSAEGMVLQLPKPVKERIHRVIGFFYRRVPGEKQQAAAPLMGRLVVSAFVSGFLVSLLEAVCTGQVYLPTIAFVLKSSPLKIQALGYLLLYNIMFIVPLIAVFALALAGITSAQFARFLKKNLGLIKIFMAALFFTLGAFLIWRG